MAALVQTIAVIDKSGKAISSNKHLVGVWKEAKAAYLDRKAEVVASRQRDRHETVRGDQRALKDKNDRHKSALSSPSHQRHHHSHRRPSADQHRSGDSVRSGPNSPITIYPASHNRFSQDLQLDSPPTSPAPGIRRSQTTGDETQTIARKPLPPRSMTTPSSPTDIDMGLAYGDLPPSPVSRSASPEQQELKPLVSKVKMLLEEADCLHHTATATIASLQKNPEAMAAVALTLAEISSLARKMAPAALASFRSSAPAVFSLLASPQFMVAGGLAVGITIVAFGGYKIIKKIKAAQAVEGQSMDEMLEIGGDVNRIENWRRGVAESELGSDAGTSVEGELITPQAHALSKLNLSENDRQHSRSSRRGSASKADSHDSSRSGHRKSVGGSSRASSKKGKERSKEKKVKKPSPLRLMFQ